MDSFLYVFKTVDGGATWKPTTHNHIMANSDIMALATNDGQTVWGCGATEAPYLEPTTTFKSTNGFKNWSSSKDFHRTVLFGMDMSTDGAIWTVGYVGDMLRSTTPSVFSVSPDMGSNDGPATVNLSGSGFWAGMKVSLARGSTVVNGTGVNVTSPYEATCSFNLNGAPAGNYDVVTVNANGLTSTLPGGFSVTSPNLWYLPEGSTAISQAGQFETWVLVENPGDKPARVDVDYMTPGGQIAGPRFTMAPASRQSVNVSDTVPNEASVSTKVASDKPIAASRSMSWDTPQKNRQAAHGSIGVNFLSNDWYLAEGSSKWGFQTMIVIENPTTSPARLVVTYMTDTGPIVMPSLTLPASSTGALDPADAIGEKDYSTKVVCTSGNEIAVERTMMWIGKTAAYPEGHCSIGVTEPSKTWFLAEGSSKWGFECWILVQNPNAQEATVDLTYMIENAGPRAVRKTVPANSRRSFFMADDIGAADASIQVSSQLPIMVERAMYRNNKNEGHESIGTVAPANDYYLAEGTTDYGFTTYVLVQNPDPGPNDVTVTYMTPGGPIREPVFTMPGNSRKTIRVNDLHPGTDLSTQVHGTKPLIAERAMYWNTGYGEACHDSIGLSAPHRIFYIPGGMCEPYTAEDSPDMETWTLVQNPTAQDLHIKLRYIDMGVNIDDTVPANSRKTYNMSDEFGDSPTSSGIVVECLTPGGKIMVEKANYIMIRTLGTDTIGAFSD